MSVEVRVSGARSAERMTEPRSTPPPPLRVAAIGAGGVGASPRRVTRSSSSRAARRVTQDGGLTRVESGALYTLGADVLRDLVEACLVRPTSPS